MTCGDGRCVEGENCITCPADCLGDENNTFCCGYNDNIAPDGCGDTRCFSTNVTCIRSICQGIDGKVPISIPSGAVKNISVFIGNFIGLSYGIGIILLLA